MPDKHADGVRKSFKPTGLHSNCQALLGIQESGLHVPNIIITEQVRKLEDADYWSYLAPLVGDVKTPKITSVRTLGEL